MTLLGIMASIWAYGFKKSIQVGSLVGFVVYGIYIICTTFVFSPARDESRILNLTPFWSYSAISSGDTRLIEEDERLSVYYGWLIIGYWYEKGEMVACCYNR